MFSWAPVWRFCSNAIVARYGKLCSKNRVRSETIPPLVHPRIYTTRLHDSLHYTNSLAFTCFTATSLQWETRKSRTDCRIKSLNCREPNHDPSVVHPAVIIPIVISQEPNHDSSVVHPAVIIPTVISQESNHDPLVVHPAVIIPNVISQLFSFVCRQPN